MCKIVEDLVEWGVNEQQMESAKKMIMRGALSHKDIADYLSLPIEMIEDIAREMQTAQPTP